MARPDRQEAGRSGGKRGGIGRDRGAGPIGCEIDVTRQCKCLRETAILFATVISALVLKERITPQRLISTALIIAGAVALRFA